MTAWLGQFCINVPDLEKAVARYEALGIPCSSRTEIPDALEAVMANPNGGSRLQLAQQKTKPFALGNALWKHYVNTRDIAATHAAALAAGCTEDSAPQRMDRWPVTISFVRDPDGYLIELVERHPWPDEAPDGDVWLGQYCLNVTDIERTIAFYELLDLTCTSRTDIQVALEAIVENPTKGSKLQLAQHHDRAEPLDMGSMWKLYVNTDDCGGLYQRAVDAGHQSLMEPTRLDRWPVTVAFIVDPDGYQVEIVERHED